MEAEWVYVTDTPHDVPGWTVVPSKGFGLHPRREAKLPKCFPFLYADTDAEVTIWLDASFRVDSVTFVEDMARHLDDGDWAQFQHPDRDCIYDEVIVSGQMTKYQAEPINEQVEHYRERGHPEHWGLWATGLIVRRRTDEVVTVGRRWWQEIDRWSYQDQLSEPFVLREAGLRPVRIYGNIFASPWLSFHAHRDET